MEAGVGLERAEADAIGWKAWSLGGWEMSSWEACVELRWVADHIVGACVGAQVGGRSHYERLAWNSGGWQISL